MIRLILIILISIILLVSSWANCDTLITPVIIAPTVIGGTINGATITNASGVGIVTSVAITGASGVSVISGSPITTNGTISLGINSSNLTGTAANLTAGTATNQSGGTVSATTITASGVTELGPQGSNPTDAEFEVYNNSGTVAHFHSNAAQGTTSGGMISLNSTPTGTPAAIAIGNRLGSLQFGGTADGTLTLYNGPTIGGYTTQNWTTSTLGSQIQFKTVPNGSTTRTLALTLDQDQSATFAGAVTVPSLDGVTIDSTTNKPVTAASLNGGVLPASLTGLALSGAITGGQAATLGATSVTGLTATSAAALLAATDGTYTTRTAVVSSNGQYLTGSLIGDSILTNLTNNPFKIGVNSLTIGTFSSTGLAITGTESISALAADTGVTDRSVCQRASDGQLFYGTGTLGICLGTSSRRYKNHIAPMDAGLQELLLLSPVTYFYNKNAGDNGARLQYGFTAEDYSHILPNLTHYSVDKKPISVDLLGTVPVIVHAIQQEDARVDELVAQLAKLQKQVLKLSHRKATKSCGGAK